MPKSHSVVTAWKTSIPWAVRLSWLESTYSFPFFSVGDFDL